MNRALVYLLATQKRSALRRYLIGLRRPRKAIGLALWVGLLGFFAWSQWRVTHDLGRGVELGRETLATGLALILLLYVVGGLMQRGLTFRPGEVDLLFPAPLRRRDLVLYKLLSTYPQLGISGLVIFALMGARLPNAPSTVAGILLCLVCGLHLQTLASLLATRISDHSFAYLRNSLRVLALLLTLGFTVLIGWLLFERGGARALLRIELGSAAPRILFYPAVAAADLASAMTWGSSLAALAGLLAYALVSLLAALALQVNFLEASLDTSQRFASWRDRARRGGPGVRAQESGPVRSLYLPALPIFQGAGAILWKNLLGAGRSLRVLLAAALTSSFFLLPAILMAGAGIGGVVMTALLPLFLQAHLAFDFRREIDNLETIKTLPLPATSIALAQIVTPVLLALVLQFTALALLAALGRTAPGLLLGAALACPVLTPGIVASGNILFLIHPSRSAGEQGRPSMSNAMGGLFISMIILAGALLPAAAAGWIALAQGASWSAALAVALAIQVLVDGALVALLGWLLRRFDPSLDRP